jgi:hypothetical protein
MNQNSLYDHFLVIRITMAILEATASMTGSFVIRDMNARAVSHIEHGMNYEAVQELRRAMGYLSTYLNQELEDATASSSFDSPYHGSTTPNRSDSELVERHGSGSRTITANASVSSSSIGEANDRTRSNNRMDQNTVSSPQLQLQHGPNIYDSTQQDQAPSSINGCRTVSTQASAVASLYYSSANAEGNGSRGSHMMHEHTVYLPQLRHSHVIYDFAFRLPFSDEAIKSVEFRTQAIVVLLYNTALAFHRCGIQSGRSVPLDRAAVSYKSILTMMGPNALQLYPEIVVAVLAITINLAHIHLELRQVPEFLSVRAILRDLMSSMSQDQVSLSDYGFFNLSLFCLDREDVSYAPAA